MVRVILEVQFPKAEYDRLPRLITRRFLLKYRSKKQEYFLGEIVEWHWSKTKTAAVVEMRKNETPHWYLRQVLEAALNEEICLTKNNTRIAENGQIRNVFAGNRRLKSLEDIKGEEIVYPIEIEIMPK